ncbi:proline--tRNA ligase [Sodalis sp. CWE]|uniref:proline--tRNA ligase n=1 Tax=Sodalis sp. CWE TaxID=2803816 RepID=UPI001C7CA6AC|nr:proline--tRNA ligase [Sodalis sp. CWE]MBX4180864.1 proline--tRNA ligase [Sodalis sp. CWE]
MRTSQYSLFTLKEVPSDAETVSHKLMLRAGMIRQLTAGLYSWLPTGLRVLQRIEKIVREEMNKAGAIEISMPVIQPANLWKESGRWIQYGQKLLRFTDRHTRSFILGPTHEEVIADLIRHEINSYKQLPLNFYQIQTKFRDEIRPRFGVLRSREFIMKDAYSFHKNQISLQETYDLMYQTYKSIFTRMNLNFRAVQANTGSMGGIISHEFQVLTSVGEDEIALSTTSNYAANIELVEAIPQSRKRSTPKEKMRIVDTSDVYTNEELIVKFSIPIEKIAKTLLVHAKKNSSHPLIALIIRGDHQLNFAKAEKLSQIAVPLKFASEDEIRIAVGVSSSYFLGPINLPLPLIIDRSVAILSDFVAGANEQNKHFFGINWERDLPLPQVADLRKVVNGDFSPDGNGVLQIKRGIEVGHIFQLGTRYSEIINANMHDQNNRSKILTMGCYGIGITRAVAAVIEQNHDERGILWPEALAPFNVAILPINMYKSFRVKEVAENLYYQLQAKGVDVLLDNRKARPGVIFSDMELIGIPHQLIIGDRDLNVNEIEYRNRRSGEKTTVKLDVVINFIMEKCVMI